LEWLAAMCSHIPNRGEQMVKYYGFYSNRSRGDRKKEASADVIPHIIEGSNISPAQRKAWARLIQKIYEVNPLECPECHCSMRIIAIIEQEQIVKKILKHVGLWDVQKRPPSRSNSPPSILVTDYADIQSTEQQYCDPEYPFEAYLN
jgi:hypothetical protein